MIRRVGALIAGATVLAACGQQPTNVTTLGVAMATPPTSGLDAYTKSHAGAGSYHDTGWTMPDRPTGRHSGGSWGNDWGGGGWGGGPGWGGGSNWGGGYWGGGYVDGWGGGWGAPWGWPYYLPPTYVSASFGNPFAPPPLAAGPWISPFFGPLGYIGI